MSRREIQGQKGQASPSRPFTLVERIEVVLIGLAGWLLVWLIGHTLRYRVEGWENFRQFDAQGKPIIYSFWHNQIFAATYFWRFRNIFVVTSSHFDGECIARIIERFGYVAARGSTTRGGAKALLVLTRSLRGGSHAAFTIDGPRGPAYKVKPGPIWLSQKSGAPIVPFHIEPKRFWSLSSWDRFRIPKPFSPALVKIGEPLSVPVDGDEETWLGRYQEAMDRIQRYSEAYWEDR